MEEKQDWDTQAKEKLDNLRASLERLVTTDAQDTKYQLKDVTSLLFNGFDLDEVEQLFFELEELVEECLAESIDCVALIR